MGMVDAFDPGRANFSRLVEQGAVLPGNLYVTEVKQKTFIDVNEEGTEAAAATSVGVGVTSLPPMVRADRPFLFAIRERFSGTVLFIGAVENPIADGE
jgi:serpin B